MGVGNSGRQIAAEMKKVGIPNAKYLTFGTDFHAEVDGIDIEHHDLVRMNGLDSIPVGASPQMIRQLTENVSEEVGTTIAESLDEKTDSLPSDTDSQS